MVTENMAKVSAGTQIRITSMDFNTALVPGDGVAVISTPNIKIVGFKTILEVICGIGFSVNTTICKDRTCRTAQLAAGCLPAFK